MKRLPAVVVTAVMLVTLPRGDAFAPQHVTFRTEDGVTLAATWYEPSQRPAPAVVLVHMLHRSRRDWDILGTRLAADGIGALAFDLRGHGDSQGSIGQDFTAMVLDVRAARGFLTGRPDVAAAQVGIAGASLGASLAALEAADDSSVRALALLSPSIEYRGLRLETAVKKYGKRPLLLVASDDDPYAARSARELQKSGGNTREVLLVSHAGHGTAMLGRDPDLTRSLVDWFRRTLL